ncbi:hypothetical protein [Cohnella massiliensis]|uniref:hypothetical protein n=1 Tax=Cohnella massiliensis TaxID=1816691 RepID=UPI001119177A|nr:hypothetical protein [Cohnella massiliensis]
MDESTEKALPDWTKSNEAEKFREKADFGWIKSSQASPSLRVIPLNPTAILRSPAQSCYEPPDRKDVRLFVLILAFI